MIKFLTKLTKDLKEDLWLMESMTFSDIFNKLEEEDRAWRIYKLGEFYLILRHVEHAKNSIERIQKYCSSEINGTFYDDFEKQWEGTDVEPNYTSETPYNYILGVWDNLPFPEMKKEIFDYIDKHYGLSTAMMGGFTKFFPEAGPYKQNAEGEMEKVSMLDYQIDDNLKAGSMLADIEEYNERLAKIKEIATNKGNLGEILKLINT